VCPMLTVALDWAYMIVPSVFSDLFMTRTMLQTKRVCKC